MSDIIDNIRVRLEEAVRQALSASESADWAVGYVYFSGLAPLVEDLARLRRLRLLLGNGADRLTLEQLVEEDHSLDRAGREGRARNFRNRRDETDLSRETVQAIARSLARIAQEDEQEAALRRLRELAARGSLEARVYARGRLHAKAYVFDYRNDGRFEKGMGIVGSSNLTLAGLSSNTELNVAVHGNENHAQLKAWFEALWQDAIPVESALAEELDRSWALYPATPWDVYMKTLFALVRDRLDDDGAGRGILIEDDVTSRLAEFQRDAVERGIRIIREHGGVFIADVVGLGKSFIGSAIARFFRRTEGRKVLIITPAALVDMWEEYSHIFDLNARVLSTGLIRSRQDILSDAKYAECDFVLLDESHHLRHPETQQYQAVEAFLHLRRPLVCLLTATPQNKGPWDIYYQLRLFQRDQEITLPIQPADLRAYFKQVEAGNKSLPALLKTVLVRRTRRHILRWYGTAEDSGKPLRELDDETAAPYLRGERPASVPVGGKKQFFPRRRLQTISYSIDATYSGLYDRIRDLLTGDARTPDNHRMSYARFGLGNYVLPEYRTIHPYNKLHQAGIHLRGLIRVLMFKRLESSVYAFQQSVRRMIRVNRAFLEGLNRGVITAQEAGFDPKTLQQVLLEEGAMPDEGVWESLREKSPYRIECFDLLNLRADVESDIAVLEELERMAGPIIPDRDAKLQRFLRGIRNGFFRNSGKILVFTQFSDTADYLFRAVTAIRDSGDVAMVTGQSRNQAQIAARFAPRANASMRKAKGPEINVLVATDVMSEGLNLQDCDVIVNYDLHWNPVRLIQRFGRIDRIGTENDTVWGFNFLPEAGIERNLRLTETLRERIEEIHRVIGEDAQILEESEALNEEALYAIYQEKEEALAAAEEGDETILDLEEAEEFFRRMREENPDEFRRIESLRDGIRAARPGSSPAEAIALCQAGGWQQFYRADDKGVEAIDIETALSRLRCLPDTPGAPLPRQHNSRVTAMLEQFRNDVELRSNQQLGAVQLRPGQRHVIQRLRECIAQTDSYETKRFCDILVAAFSDPLPAALHTQLNALRRQHIDQEKFIQQLKKLYFEYGLDRTRNRNLRAFAPEDEVPRIIASESFLD
ncbi:MAG TPA: phospholipase D-like domain-containing protein [Candidatus Hydrogenedentes bacterium]|nr:phospholipase D-like domain-containing protein [Candidatus Hydrogenedentota bacterium]